MGKPWMKALFADLAPKADSDSGFSPEAFEESRSAKWNKQRTQSSPPTSTKQASQNYDIAEHARASLRLNESPSKHTVNQYLPPACRSANGRPAHGRDPNARWREGHGSAQGLPYENPSTSGSSPSRNPATPPPLGPRPILFPQEVPYQNSRRPAIGTGGFVDPRQAPLRHQRETSTSSQGVAQTPDSSAQRRVPYPFSSNSASPVRQHISSNPSHPIFLSTPPPTLPYRPHSDPQATGQAPKPPTISKSSSDDHGKGKPNQCHGTTGAGKRCTRTVKNKTVSPKTAAQMQSTADFRMGYNALKQLDRRLSMRKKPAGPSKPDIKRKQRVVEIESDSDTDYDNTSARLSPVKGVSGTEDADLEELPVFCFQHVKQTLEQRGTFINSKSVDFQDWIPAYLPQETQLQLRHEMVKPRAEERRGYIYVHEFPFSSGNSETTTFIKLGRSVRPVARLAEWKSQCKSRQPIVRDIFPLHFSHPLHPGHTADSLVNTYRASPSHQHGRLLFSEQGANHHQRWERLCLIELAGIAAIQGRDRHDEEIARQACVDCGKIHIELFLVNKGSYEKDIREMVLRWQRFVETVL